MTLFGEIYIYIYSSFKKILEKTFFRTSIERHQKMYAATIGNGIIYNCIWFPLQNHPVAHQIADLHPFLLSAYVFAKCYVI